MCNHLTYFALTVILLIPLSFFSFVTARVWARSGNVRNTNASERVLHTVTHIIEHSMANGSSSTVPVNTSLRRTTVDQARVHFVSKWRTSLAERAAWHVPKRPPSPSTIRSSLSPEERSRRLARCQATSCPRWQPSTVSRRAVCFWFWRPRLV